MRLLVSLSLVAVCGTAAIASAQSAPPAAPLPLPTAIADSTFWRIVNAFSEPEQPFTTYYVSNEVRFPDLVSSFLDLNSHGGAYIGVAPEQNYHYIAAVRPRIAFILDIRRQAIIQHLMYKAVFELSPTRADFISLLFTKARPANVSDTATAYQTWEAFWDIPTDTARFTANMTRIFDHLTKTHRFALTPLDSSLLRTTYQVFYAAGPNLTETSRAGVPTSPSTFANLTSAVDLKGVERSFLATPAAYRTVRDLELANLVIPMVGDFSGTHTLRSIGGYLSEHGTTVTAFYVSNVETYLKRDGRAPGFQANVAALPRTPQSVLLRGIVPLSLCNIQRWVDSGFLSC